MLARIPASRRLAWRLADVLSLMAHGRGPRPLGDFGMGLPESLPLSDPERRHALYEASCALESEGAIAVEPLLYAIDALLGECDDACRRAADLVKEADYYADLLRTLHETRQEYAEARREQTEARRELWRSLGVPEDVAFGLPQEEWGHLLDRVAALRDLASAAATRDAEAAVSDAARPTKNAWELLREDA